HVYDPQQVIKNLRSLLDLGLISDPEGKIGRAKPDNVIVLPAREARAPSATCHAVTTVDYDGPEYAFAGAVYRLTVGLGAGEITNGSNLTIYRVRMDLDCDEDQ